MEIDEVSKQFDNLANFIIFWENMIKCLVMYEIKCMADVVFKTISIKHKVVNEKTFANYGVNFQNILLLSILC